MESAMLEKRIGKCEDKIDNLATEMAENKVNVSHIQEIVKDFKVFMNECVLAMRDTRNEIANLNKAQEATDKKLCDLKEQIEDNEELYKVDTRPIFKSIITKILTGIIIAGLGIGLLISLLT